MEKEMCMLIILLEICELVNSLQLLFGNCPLIYDESCNSQNVGFILSIGRKNTSYHLNPFKLEMPSEFDNQIPVKILVHGYGGLIIDKAIKSTREAYLDMGYNVILVDWGPLSEVPCYVAAFLNTWHVGQCVALLATSLMPFGIDPILLHLIGFSLGAHVAGFTGTNLKKSLNFLPGRITGLDPALPFFATLNKEWKLDSTDAHFVDVIHTSSGTFGKIEALGHVDFYVNGGVLQPDCYNAPRPPICSHVMSGIYFAKSIKKDKFVGVRCDSVMSYYLGFCFGGPQAVMGEYVDKKIRGSYFVETSPSTLFTLSYVYDNLIV